MDSRSQEFAVEDEDFFAPTRAISSCSTRTIRSVEATQGYIKEVERMHLEVDPPNPGEVRPGVPDALSSVILRCLAKDPGERFQTAAELATPSRRSITNEARVPSVQALHYE